MKHSIFLIALLLQLSSAFADSIEIKVQSVCGGNEMLSLFNTREAPPKALLWKEFKAQENIIQKIKIQEAGFYKLMFHGLQYDIWLEPGKNIEILLQNHGEIILGGESAQLNNFLVKTRQKYPNRDRYSEQLLRGKKIILDAARFEFYEQAYLEQLQSIQQSTLSNTDQALAKGWAQALFLENIYKPIIENKVFGKTNKAEIVSGYAKKLAQLNVFAEIIYYPKWGDFLKEVMYTRMETGKLNLRTPNLWISEWAKTISNKLLREHFIAYLIEKETLMRYFDSKTVERFETAKKFVDSPTIILQIDNCIAKIDLGNDVHPDVSQITFDNIEGKQITLGDFKGKYVFIDFWSTSCNPCIGEMPYLHELEKKFENKPIEFISIALERKIGNWKAFLQNNILNSNQFIMLDLNKNPIWTFIGLSGIPRFVLLDKNSKVIYKNAYRPSNPILEHQIRELLSN